MNKCILLGRLVSDPKAYKKENSTTVKFTVAVDRRFKTENGASADFPSCVAFGKTAEFVEKYFKKGVKIALTGRIQTGEYTNKDGQKVYTTDVVAEEVEFAESKKATGEEAAPPSVDEFMEVPDDILLSLPFK